MGNIDDLRGTRKRLITGTSLDNVYKSGINLQKNVTGYCEVKIKVEN